MLRGLLALQECKVAPLTANLGLIPQTKGSACHLSFLNFQAVFLKFLALNASRSFIGQPFFSRTKIDHVNRKAALQIRQHPYFVDRFASGPLDSFGALSKLICNGTSLASIFQHSRPTISIGEFRC